MDFYQDNLFKSLVRDLLNESYSQQRGFLTKPFESVCSEVELDAEVFLGTASSNIFEQEKEKQSFERVKATLFLILSYMDLSGVTTFPEAPMGAFFPADFSASSNATPRSLVASYFRHLKTTQQFPLPQIFLDKIIAKHLIDEVEEQCLNLIRVCSDSIQESKERVIQACLVRSAQRTDFSPIWKPRLENLMAAAGLEPSQADLKIFLDAFKIINQNPKPELDQMKLGLLGALVSSFGILSHALPLTPVDAEKLASLLLKLNKRKTEAVLVNVDLSDTWLGEIEKDYTEALNLIAMAVEGQHLIAA